MKIITGEKIIKSTGGVFYTKYTIGEIIKIVYLGVVLPFDIVVVKEANGLGFTLPNDSIIDNVIVYYKTNDEIIQIGNTFIKEPLIINQGIHILEHFPEAIDDVYIEGEMYNGYKLFGKKLAFIGDTSSLQGTNHYVTYYTKKLVQKDEKALNTIYKETPFGEINGNNNSFLLHEKPYQILDVWVDGALFYDYLVEGNTLLLIDSYPLSNVQVDYNYEKLDFVDVGDDLNLNGVLQKISWLLGQTGNSVNYARNVLISEVNTTLREISTGRYYNQLLQTNMLGDAWFMKQSYVINLNYKYFQHNDIVLRENCNPGDIVMKIRGCLPEQSGYILMGGTDLVEYNTIKVGITDKANTTELFLKTPIRKTYSRGTKLEYAYKLPNNYGKLDKIVYNDRNRTVIGEHYYENGIREMIEGTFLFLDRILKRHVHESTTIEIIYYVKEKYYSNPEEKLPIPDEFLLNTIPYIVAGELAYARQHPISPTWLNKGYRELANLYGYGKSNKLRQTRIEPVHYNLSKWNRHGKFRKLI